MMDVFINGDKYRVEPDADEPLLWTLRDRLGLLGTKYGCGAGLCGACTVIVDGIATRSCSVLSVDVAGATITTIESRTDAEVEAVRRAWTDVQVPQCGYCQAGVVMTVAAELKANPSPDPEAVVAAIGNLCRCGTQVRIRAAIHALKETAP